jgi:anti-sigma regulatory factor (Ser/Thr protein kinase)
VTTSVGTHQPGFVHPALFYRSQREYLDGLVPFITAGLEGQEPVAVAVPGPNLRLLSDALGSAAAHINLIDMAEAGRNPGRIIPAVLRAFADRHPDRHVRIIGEPIWAGRTATEYPACVQHEALINSAFAGRHVTIVCPYDAASLDPRVLSDAYATHPTIQDDGREKPSEYYAPGSVIAEYNQPLSTPAQATALPFTSPEDLPAGRRAAVHRAEELGLSPDQIDVLRVVVTELVTNSLVHTDGGCQLELWRDGEQVVCSVRDQGQLTDPLAGRRPPGPSQLSGRGLLLVNQLSDLVRTHTSPAGTTIQAYLPLA